jgi:exosortase C (VPDSG-CTERM-specific)
MKSPLPPSPGTGVAPTGLAAWKSTFSRSPQLKNLAFAFAALTLCFVKPLFDMTVFAMHSQFYSHLPLMPVISAYFVWIQRDQIRLKGGAPPRGWAAVSALIGICLGATYFIFFCGNTAVPLPDQLAFGIAAYLCCFVSACLWFLDPTTLRQIAFSLGMLAFMIPFPTAVNDGLEIFFQHTSAMAAELMFAISGTDFLRDDLVIKLPNITLQVAPECSGIRSSLVLFITSFIAGKMFLSTFRNRLFLAVFVIPLAILRNGFRIFTIGWLCVHYGPDMIHSPIHHKGGPIFFALSLVPFFVFLWWMRRLERRPVGTGSNPPPTPLASRS